MRERERERERERASERARESVKHEHFKGWKKLENNLEPYHNSGKPKTLSPYHCKAFMASWTPFKSPKTWLLFPLESLSLETQI